MKIKLAISLIILFITNFSFGQLKIEDLQVDTTITGFHFVENRNNTKVFTPTGKSEMIFKNMPVFYITLFSDATYQTSKNKVENTLSVVDAYGNTASDVIKKDTIINGCQSYIISFTETDGGTGQKDLIFTGFIIKGNVAIIFECDDFDNGKYTDKLKKTFYSLKI